MSGIRSDRHTLRDLYPPTWVSLHHGGGGMGFSQQSVVICAEGSPDATRRLGRDMGLRLPTILCN